MLTEREKEVLEAIVKYIEENEYVPSVREICKEVGRSKVYYYCSWASDEFRKERIHGEKGKVPKGYEGIKKSW